MCSQSREPLRRNLFFGNRPRKSTIIQSYAELVARGERKPGEKPSMKGQPCAFTLHSDNPRCWPARASTSDPRGSPGPCLLRLNPVSHPCDTVTLPALWWTPAPPSLPWGLFLLRSPPPSSFSGLHSSLPRAPIPLSCFISSVLITTRNVLLVGCFCFPAPWSCHCRR